MAPFNQFLFPSSVIRPVHMTLTGPHPNLSSLVHAIEDPYFDKNSHHRHEDIYSPKFDVRESDSAFFLEGEFPGVMRKEDLTIEKLGPRTLLVEANVTRFDVRAEWGQSVLAPISAAHSLKAEQPQMVSDKGKTGKRDEEGAYEQNNPAAEWKEEKSSGDGLRIKLAERHVGYLQRSFTFPCAVDIDALKARLRCGLLVMMVPKMRDTKNVSKKIDIED
jgi:HSP20 family protein